MKPNPTGIAQFRRIVRHYWKAHGRHGLPWRHTKNPYRILVSEIMLQQTQVARVIPKYKSFLKRFPTFAALARSNTREVLAAWQGLGYNRRAILLQRLAAIIVKQYRGRLPHDPVVLQTLPAIGVASAGAITAFAFNRPVVFIETNIRRAFIYFFFPKRKRVKDTEILPLVRAALPHQNPRACPPKCSCRREWYWALMDYGAMLADQLQKNPNVRSARYRRQPRFEGSHRQLRGKILRILLEKHALPERIFIRTLGVGPEKARQALEELRKEGFVRKTGATIRIV